MALAGDAIDAMTMTILALDDHDRPGS